jgi:hypothetical protein
MIMRRGFRICILAITMTSSFSGAMNEESARAKTWVWANAMTGKGQKNVLPTYLPQKIYKRILGEAQPPMRELLVNYVYDAIMRPDMIPADVARIRHRKFYEDPTESIPFANKIIDEVESHLEYGQRDLERLRNNVLGLLTGDVTAIPLKSVDTGRLDSQFSQYIDLLPGDSTSVFVPVVNALNKQLFNSVKQYLQSPGENKMRLSQMDKLLKARANPNTLVSSEGGAESVYHFIVQHRPLNKNLLEVLYNSIQRDLLQMMGVRSYKSPAWPTAPDLTSEEISDLAAVFADFDRQEKWKNTTQEDRERFIETVRAE